jgi:DNA-binding response OmpR family regulator
MTTKILWLEGNRAVTPSFVPGLRAKGYQVECVPTCKAALARLDSFSPSLVVVNAASFRGNGKRTCRALCARLNGRPLFLICEQEQKPVETDANQVLVLPFTIRKLLNRIQALAPHRTGETLRRGLLVLYPDCQLVQVNGGDPERLTPTLTALLHALMQRPGELWGREELFREVWQTDYVGDTRTLDTHISWLRRKIEPDSKNPVLLKTVRGVGYRLDV